MFSLKAATALATLFLAFAGTEARAETPKKQPKTAGPETELYVVDRRLQDAIVGGDIYFLDRHLGDDFILTKGWFSGSVQTKTDMLKGAKSRREFYIHRNVSSQVVELHGDVALVFGRLDVRRLPRAKDGETEQMCYSLSYIHVYVRRKDIWQIVSHRTATEVTPSPCSVYRPPSNNSFKPKPLRGSA